MTQGVLLPSSLPPLKLFMDTDNVFITNITQPKSCISSQILSVDSIFPLSWSSPSWATIKLLCCIKILVDVFALVAQPVPVLGLLLDELVNVTRGRSRNDVGSVPAVTCATPAPVCHGSSRGRSEGYRLVTVPRGGRGGERELLVTKVVFAEVSTAGAGVCRVNRGGGGI